MRHPCPRNINASSFFPLAGISYESLDRYVPFRILMDGLDWYMGAFTEGKRNTAVKRVEGMVEGVLKGKSTLETFGKSHMERYYPEHTY